MVDNYFYFDKGFHKFVFIYIILKDEATIHTRYMKFRLMYPTGFVGPHVLRELCIDVLSESECENFVNMVMRFNFVKPNDKSNIPFRYFNYLVIRSVDGEQSSLGFGRSFWPLKASTS